MIKGVIFDLDGLMIDSEQLAIQAWQLYLDSLGVSLSEDEYRSIVGASHDYSLDFVREHVGIEIDVADLDQAFWRNMLALFDQGGLDPMPGLLPLVKEISAMGISLGVASNSPTSYVLNALEKIGVKGYFSVVVGSDQVVSGKPAPDVYARAANCLGLLPDHCLAIEDTQVGAQAALAAGIPCILIPNPLLGEEDFDMALGIYPTLNDLLDDFNAVVAHGPA